MKIQYSRYSQYSTMPSKKKSFNKKKKGGGNSTTKSTTTTSGGSKVTTRTKLSDYKFNVGEARNASELFWYYTVEELFPVAYELVPSPTKEIIPI